MGMSAFLVAHPQKQVFEIGGSWMHDFPDWALLDRDMLVKKLREFVGREEPLHPVARRPDVQPGSWRRLGREHHPRGWSLRHVPRARLQARGNVLSSARHGRDRFRAPWSPARVKPEDVITGVHDAGAFQIIVSRCVFESCSQDDAKFFEVLLSERKPEWPGLIFYVHIAQDERFAWFSWMPSSNGSLTTRIGWSSTAMCGTSFTRFACPRSSSPAGASCACTISA
jgi:hypothetical protein